MVSSLHSGTRGRISQRPLCSGLGCSLTLKLCFKIAACRGPGLRMSPSPDLFTATSSPSVLRSGPCHPPTAPAGRTSSHDHSHLSVTLPGAPTLQAHLAYNPHTHSYSLVPPTLPLPEGREGGGSSHVPSARSPEERRAHPSGAPMGPSP